MHVHSSSRRWLLAIYVCSGVSGLVFEILWARQLSTVLGATTRAIAAVVSVFMAGLALGNTLGSRVAARTAFATAAYGVVEIATGLLAAAVTLLLPRLESLHSMPLRFGLAGVLLLVPSALMGTTFPLMVKAYQGPRLGGSGLLYSLNTMGAALGCLTAGFAGIGALGILRTGLLAAGLNLACGAAALLVSRREPAPGLDAADPVAFDPGPVRGGAPGFAAVLAFACGLTALAAEVLWTRELIPHLNSSSYAFAVILTVFLAANATGSWLASRRATHRSPAASARLLVLLQLTLALLLASAPRLSMFIEYASDGYVGVSRVMSLSAWLQTVGALFLRTVAAVGVPAGLMGASFALCLALASESRSASRAAGRVAAANTGGAILGSASAGFVVLPALGVVRGLALAAAAAVAIAVTAAHLAFLRRRGSGMLAVAAVGAALIWMATPASRTPFLGRIAASTNVLLIDEGPQDTTVVLEGFVGTSARRYRQLLSNGISYAGDEPASQRYMGLLGHLPALLSRHRSAALVICVGTGTTARSLALYPEVERLDLVDISPVVHRTLPLFAHVNDRVWADPRVRIHEADGRHFMGAARSPWGIVTLEPPPPRAAGAASLYSIELYRRARAAMDAGAVIAQWLPLHGLTESELWMMTRTFVQVFPDAALFVLTPQEAALIGSVGPLSVDADGLRRRLEEPVIRDALAHIGLDAFDTDALAARIIALAPLHGEALAKLAGAGPVITDDRPLIEQFAVGLAADRAHDTDGRLPFLRRLLVAGEHPLPLGGAPPANLDAARAHFRRWLEQVTRGAPAGDP